MQLSCKIVSGLKHKYCSSVQALVQSHQSDLEVILNLPQRRFTLERLTPRNAATLLWLLLNFCKSIVTSCGSFNAIFPKRAACAKSLSEIIAPGSIIDSSVSAFLRVFCIRIF